MNSLKRNHHLIILLILLFLILLFFRFRIEIKDIFISNSELEKEELDSSQSIKRRLSYTGTIAEAKKLIADQYYSLANIEIKNAIKEKPTLIEPYLLLAEIHIQQENTSQLLPLIETLEKKFPNNPQTTVLKIKYHLIEGNFDTADFLLSEETLSPSLQFYKALLLALKNDHETATEILNTLKKIKATPQTLSVTKNREKSIDKEKPQKSFSPEMVKKIKEISFIYQEFEKLSEGKQPHLFALISKSLSENNEYHLARKFAETAIKEDEKYIDGWILKGYSEYLLQNYDRALLDLKKSYELDPIRAETHYFLALTLEKLGQNTEAALFFEKSLENDFNFSTEIKWKLIDIFTDQKKYDQVIALYKEIIEETPDSEAFVPVIHNVIDILRKPEIALEITEQLVEKNENDITALNLYGWALISNKRIDQAEKVLEKAFLLDEKNSRTFLNLGLLAEKQQKITEAIDLYRQSYEISKDQPHSPIANLAADRYNQLIDSDKPEIQEEGRNASSP